MPHFEKWKKKEIEKEKREKNYYYWHLPTSRSLVSLKYAERYCKKSKKNENLFLNNNTTPTKMRREKKSKKFFAWWQKKATIYRKRSEEFFFCVWKVTQASLEEWNGKKMCVLCTIEFLSLGVKILRFKKLFSHSMEKIK